MTSANEIAAKDLVQKAVDNTRSSTVFGKNHKHTNEVRSCFDKAKAAYEYHNLDTLSYGKELQQHLQSVTGRDQVPHVYAKGKYIGGWDEVCEMMEIGVFYSKVI